MLIDKPLPELLVYQGRNPKPRDFDEYWERAIKELDSVLPAAELIPAEFKCSSVDCYDLWYTGVRNARIHAKYVLPKNIKSPIPAAFLFHGYSGSAPDWSSLLSYACAGMAIAAMDCRGQGGLSEDTGGVKGTTLRGQIIRGLDDSPDNLLFRHIFLDTVQLVRAVTGFGEIDKNRLACFGGSQGGGLTIACAGLEPRIKRAAPRYPFLCDYKRVWEMDLAKDAYMELKEFFRHHDPQHKREDEIFYKLGYIDTQFLAPGIKAEVLMQTGLMDTVCPPSTQFAAYNKITSKKNVLIYPDFAHEEGPGMGDNTFNFISGV